MSEYMIYKYEIPMTGGVVAVQGGWRTLSVANQNEKLVAWGVVNIHYPLSRTRFVVVVTGGSPPEASQYARHASDPVVVTFRGTVLFDGGAFVAHVYEIDGGDLSR